MKSAVLDFNQSYLIVDTADLVSSASVITHKMLEFVVQMNLLQTVPTVMCVWWGVVITMRVEWKCAITTLGGQCVMTTGAIWML